MAESGDVLCPPVMLFANEDTITHQLFTRASYETVEQAQMCLMCGVPQPRRRQNGEAKAEAGMQLAVTCQYSTSK